MGPDDHLYVEGFALNVFSKADKQDRAGRSDLYVTSLHLFYYYFSGDVSDASVAFKNLIIFLLKEQATKISCAFNS